MKIDRNRKTRNRMRRSLHLWLGCIAAAFLVAGCGAPMRLFIHPEADLSFYQKVGVAPFRSMSSDQLAGEKFSIEFTTALLATEKFDVLDPGIFAYSLGKALGQRESSAGLTLDELKKIAEFSGVQGVFEGTVTQYDMVSSVGGQYPVISVEARLLDAETGSVVWMATTTEKGGPRMPIIGFGETHTLGELTQKLCNRLVSTIE